MAGRKVTVLEFKDIVARRDDEAVVEPISETEEDALDRFLRSLYRTLGLRENFLTVYSGEKRA